MNADRSSIPKAPTGRAVLLEERLTRGILRAFYDVYNELKGGYLESVYAVSLEIAFHDAGLSANREVSLPVHFRGVRVGDFRADFIVESRVILEVKAGRALDEAHGAQLLHYLRSAKLSVGLLLHFGPQPRFRRVVSQPR